MVSVPEFLHSSLQWLAVDDDIVFGGQNMNAQLGLCMRRVVHARNPYELARAPPRNRYSQKRSEQMILLGNYVRYL
jgi:hypothetical protein